MFRQYRWRIAFPYVALVLIAMSALALYLSGLIRRTYVADLQTQLTNEARLLAEMAKSPALWISSSEELDALSRVEAGHLQVRVTLIAPDGSVLGDSQEDHAQMENHLFRPEVQQALQGVLGSSVRFSDTLGYYTMYVAMPVQVDTQTLGVVRLALPLRAIEANVARLRMAILVATLIMAWFATFFAVVMAGSAARPVQALTAAFARLVDGDLSARILPTSDDEIGQLARDFDQTADRLQDMITSAAAEREQLAAVLEYMADGVVITDAIGSVQLINPAAVRLLEIGAAPIAGVSFAQVVRDHTLITAWRDCQEHDQEQTVRVKMGQRGSYLQAILTPLRGTRPKSCLILLQDLTQVRNLEIMRRDFVSNVSHELRTPLASMKALAETLHDGALEDPHAARVFLERMDTELDAMTQMVQDLLELSRIESGQMPLVHVVTHPADIVVPAVERLRPQADRAGVQLTVQTLEAVPWVLADGARVQEVITNLVQNAIRFTPCGGHVEVSARISGSEVEFVVQDNGVGIPAEALPRIFERFYKVDRARASEGTGLGLAIAKHIVESHGGRIGVESVEGVGSTFRFTLPIAPATPTDAK